MLVKLHTFPHATEAQLALTRLNQEGIQGMLRHETIHSILPIQALAIQLWVNEEDLERARTLLSDTSIDIVEEDFRDIDHPEIDYLRRQQERKRWLPWLWVLILVLILMLVLFGW